MLSSSLPSTTSSGDPRPGALQDLVLQHTVLRLHWAEPETTQAQQLRVCLQPPMCWSSAAPGWLLPWAEPKPHADAGAARLLQLPAQHPSHRGAARILLSTTAAPGPPSTSIQGTDPGLCSAPSQPPSCSAPIPPLSPPKPAALQLHTRAAKLTGNPVDANPGLPSVPGI